MSSVHYLRDGLAVVGWSCRLPGARSVTELWSLLLEGRCAISSVPPDRFSLDRFGHPRRQERGKSYSWAAGIVEDIWGFDPAVFGISPREAVQMDPQQRLLLQMTWEALEDAGIRPSSLSGTEVGVFVGASQTDYGHSFFSDHAIADSQFATGTALSVLSNRISYAFDLRGPSLTIDTACSSSLVALHHAAEAIRAGRIDTAIVAGINLIASPASFIAFSQASMLSPTGLCHTFSAEADGFVRGEGGAVLVLRRTAHAQASRNPIHALVLATDVNSDGRTNGISLPSLEAQETLLQRIYSKSGIEPDRLAFVEAHGTGTPAGDPIEANALGRSLGVQRSAPLPIGSIKTNIGHLEPASGIAGLLKAMLALNHGILPRSLHFTKPNPHIDFERLKLTVCREALLLPASPQRCAGVNSFGFGGTNAHAVIAPGRKPAAPAAGAASGGSGFFTLSAETKPALIELAQLYGQRVAQLSDQDTEILARGIAHRREHLSQRIVIAATDSGTVGEALNAYAAGSDHPHLTSGSTIGDDIPVAFVYSGNGSQWAGMGRAAYRNNPHFRSRFDEIDGHFKPLAGWSLREAMFSDTLSERLSLTSVAQPLIFAIQGAATEALRAAGLRPSAVLGHSVGEVAAAEAAGVLDLRTAVKVIYFRSKHQELACGTGRMAVVLASAETAAPLAAAGQVEIGAINSPRAVTVAGPSEALAAFKSLAEARGITVIDLDLDYPFHTALMAPVEHRLLADLKTIEPRDAEVPFVSTVSGAVMPGARLGSSYWWRNVRDPVRFADAVRAAGKLGARYFVEIGPRAALLRHISDSLDGQGAAFATLSVLDRSDSDVDPFGRALARALVSGAQVDLATVMGADPGPGVSLPTYPWQQAPFRFAPTPEAVGMEGGHHPFLGSRLAPDLLEWHAHIDTALYPALADHKLGDQVIFPGAGFFEIGLAAAQKWLKADQVTIANCEILKPLDLTNAETREVMTRVSAGSNTVEILSRPRLSQVAWTLHSRAKILHANPADAGRAVPIPKGGRPMDGETLYRLADATGLNYGPAFSLVSQATIHDEDRVSVELAPQAEPTPFLLDPMRLDACVHSMITLFPQLRAEERGVTFVPVRVDESTLFRPHVAPARALMEVLTRSERSVLANFYIYDADDRAIAIFRGARCQAIPVKRMRALERVALVERALPVDGTVLGRTGVAATAASILERAGSLGLPVDETATSEGAPLLLEGLATAAAYEIARGLADDKGEIEVAGLAASGRLPEELSAWLTNIVMSLEAAGLATLHGQGAWRISADAGLPSSASVVKALALEHPARAAELLIAGALSDLAQGVATGQAIAAPAILAPAVFDFHDSASGSAAEASETLWTLLRAAKGLWPKDRALRVLQVGYAPLARSFASVADGAVQLTVFEPNRRLLDRARMHLPHGSARLLDADQADQLGRYDLIVAVDGLHRLPAEIGLERLGGCLAPSGLLAAIEPGPSLFKDLVFGVEPWWFAGGTPDYPVGPLQTASQWTAALEQAGFDAPQACAVRVGSDVAVLAVAGARSAARAEQVPEVLPAAEARTALVLAGAGIAAGLAGEGLAVRRSEAATAETDAPAPDLVVLEPPSADPLDPVAALTERCLQIKASAERLADASAPLWLLFSGARPGAGPVNPVETGAWAFSRTLANEFPKLDVRRIDVAPGLDPKRAGEQIGAIVLSGTAETEFQLDGDGVRAVRIEQLRRVPEPKGRHAAPAARLVRESRSGARVAWRPIAQPQIGPDEVEIAVEATGLNFRDLMWTLGLLPDDMLEDGFTGPGLGLECAGRVARVGARVETLRLGDRVVALAAASFSTHVAVPASQVARIADDMSFAGATTIPVAFLTAYYSLVTLARLKRREWVLIHGGAGGVGMAAIQVASARGARIVATAGSPAKRGMLRALGVPHVLDSRSPDIVDEVRALTGDGVDVVLNSLAGEAMERSIACLRPFGRFVELGKRDYVSNTHVGLRPFRRNLSYFGVDVDQLVGGRRALGERVFAEMMRHFEKGIYRPLPHSVFQADDVSDAFDLMQHSHHVGKIVVLPPRLDAVRAPERPFAVSAAGTHVVTGGLTGFGLETARWLADRGARHLVLVGRRGAATPEAEAALADFARRGIVAHAAACDVSDLRAVEKLFERIHATMPPVCGVMHAAMVLDDAIVPNLDRERFTKVLEPKVRGAENLDVATRGTNLDYFVLFSSVTTMMGNPGQGNYVAANAYMEGLARRRRQEGLPALAVGWGPIADVGVVARDERLKANLKKIVGVSGMRAREGLELLEQALARAATSAAETAAMTISPNDGVFGGDRLVVLRSPTYAALVQQGRQGEGEAGQIDLKALVQSEGIDAARRKVGDIIVSHLARVLHAREDDISRIRPLAEIGLDSLMALELVGNLEASFGGHIALSSSAGALTVSGVADAILAQVDAEIDRKEAAVERLAEQHLESVPVKDFEAVRGIIGERARMTGRLLS